MTNVTPVSSTSEVIPEKPVNVIVPPRKKKLTTAVKQTILEKPINVSSVFASKDDKLQIVP